jgi:hypothetical protein
MNYDVLASLDLLPHSIHMHVESKTKSKLAKHHNFPRRTSLDVCVFITMPRYIGN